MEVNLFEIVITTLSSILIYLIKDATNSMKELNTNVAVILERVQKHDLEIDRLREKTDKTHNDLIEIKAKVER
jgi:hypothetical protein